MTSRGCWNFQRRSLMFFAYFWFLAIGSNHQSFSKLEIGDPNFQNSSIQRTIPYPMSKHGGTYMYNYYFPPAPSSTPWAPCWSPDGRWIAVGMHGSIWKVDPQARTGFELTYNRKYHSSPDWSPDGKWIVYTADDNGQTIQLEILNAETGESHPLTNDPHLYTDPVFSPDGSYLAYVSTKPNGFFNVYVRPIHDGLW